MLGKYLVSIYKKEMIYMAEIDVKNLTFSYDGKREVLSDISFQIEKGETVGLIGANGAGKSTFLKLLVGLETGFDGNITIQDIPVSKKNLTEIREKTGYVFQDSESQLFLSTVYDDVAFGPQNYGYSKEEVDNRVKNALDKLNIFDLKDRPVYMLSGGQKKLAAIATVLAMKPQIILLDEPSVALDPRNRKNLIRIINELEGTKIIASHDLDLIMDTCSRSVLLSGHRSVKIGKTSEILEDEELLQKNGLELPLSLSR
jgi:cobalt/nickel transport system ATP-binding protein